MGRTGKLFAYEWAGVTPDVMCLAKALGNGFPIGACLATAKAAQGMTVGTHGSTFGGNPLATEVGNAVLDVLTAPGFLADVERRSVYLRQGLTEMIARRPKIFKGLRGRGFLCGIECLVPNGALVDALREEKLLTVIAGENVLRLLPPLVVSEAQIDKAVGLIDQVAGKMEAGL
jgi:acetylornithine/N-succinyldiaminopimelate aminotransferase